MQFLKSFKLACTLFMPCKLAWAARGPAEETQGLKRPEKHGRCTGPASELAGLDAAKQSLGKTHMPCNFSRASSKHADLFMPWSSKACRSKACRSEPHRPTAQAYR